LLFKSHVFILFLLNILMLYRPNFPFWQQILF